MSDELQRPGESTPVVVARPVWYARAAAPPADLLMPTVRRRDALLSFALVFVATILLPYLPELSAPRSVPDASIPPIDSSVILRKWCEAGLAAGLLALFLLRQAVKPRAFGLRRDRVGRQLLWSLAALGCVYAALLASAVYLVPYYLRSPDVERELAHRYEFVQAMPIDNLLATIMLLVAVAVHEELVFRGLMLPYLRRLLGNWWWAGLVSALIFAALHVPQQGLFGGIQVFLVAVVLTVFFIRTRSLLTVMVAHLLFNFLQFQLLRLLPDPRQVFESFPA